MSDQLDTDFWQPILTLSAEVSSVADDGELIHSDAESVNASDGAPGDARFDETSPVQPGEELPGPVRSSDADNEDTGTLMWAAEVAVGGEDSTNNLTSLAGQKLLGYPPDTHAYIQDEIS